MRRATIALMLGLAVLGVGIGVVLARSPLTVAGTNSVALQGSVATHGDISGCQESGTVPQGTSAIRVSLAAVVGPRVSLKVLSGSRVVSEGERAAGWGVDDNVVVPVRRLSRAVRDARVCTSIGPTVEPRAREGLLIDGTKVRPLTTERSLLEDAKLRMEYLRPSSKSWWSFVPSIAHHMGLGHAAGGAWLVFLVLALMLVVVALASRLVWDVAAMAPDDPPQAPEPTRPSSSSGVGGALRRIPRAAWICAAVACLNAACWSIITPPFQVPDEPSHFAYTQLLAENTQLPTSAANTFSLDEEVALRDLDYPEIRMHPNIGAISATAAQRQLQADFARHLPRSGEGGVGGAYNAPPLYYLLEVLPYGLGSGGSLLDQLELMRLLSALMGGVTALFAFLFVRETLPKVRWAWTVGGLSVALAPMLGFMSGALNPDAMLFAVSGALFYCLARGFRRGLTRRLAVAIGLLTAVGFLTKLNFIGLAPGVLLGLIILGVRSSRANEPGAYRSLGIAFAIAASPVYVYVFLNLLTGHPVLGAVSSVLTGTSGSISSEFSYVWQLYLPRLPGMGSDFPGVSTPVQLWFDRSVGFYGWLDTSFPGWVDTVALFPAGVVAMLLARSLVLDRIALRRRLTELATYAVIGFGLLVLIGTTAYLTVQTEGGAGDAEPRYLLPLLPLFGVGIALAARGAGRRWGPTVGALLVVLLLAHDVFSQLLVVARYYA
jgi:hypothetical protein